MVEGGMGVLWSWAALLALASAGPLLRFPREVEDYQNGDLSAYVNFTANEVCFSDNQVFPRGAVMPNPGPCEECRCEPPSIVCNMIKCPVNNNGCRTIQKPNHCCPDYNCECDYNGQLYNDGELVDVPDQPCQVCYCKGGDVMCNSIKCYERADCEPLLLPGQCCPKYENCPVRDMESPRSDDRSNQTRTSNNSPNMEMQPWLLTKFVHHTSGLPKQADDTTTEDGNIIIVSDWLSERRTTTEEAANQEGVRREVISSYYTSGPSVATYPDLTTLQQQSLNSDTITPMDEVIFTRVDTPRPKEQEGDQLFTTNQPNPVEDETNLPEEPDNATKFPSSEANTKEELTTTSTYSTSVNLVNFPQNKSSLIDEEKQKYGNVTNNDFTYSSKPATVTTNKSDGTEFKAEVSPGNPELSTQSHLKEVKMHSVNENTKPAKIDYTSKSEQELERNVDQSTDRTSETNTQTENDSTSEIESDPKNFELSEEITLEHMFGFDKSNLDETELSSTTNDPATEKAEIIEIPSSLPEKLINSIHQTITTHESPETIPTEETFSDNSLGEESNVRLVLAEVQENEENKVNSSLEINEKILKLEYEPTTTMDTLEEMDFSTPYFTEDHMNGLILDTSKLVEEGSNENEEVTYNEESTTELVNTSHLPTEDEQSSTKTTEPFGMTKNIISGDHTTVSDHTESNGSSKTVPEKHIRETHLNREITTGEHSSTVNSVNEQLTTKSPMQTELTKNTTEKSLQSSLNDSSEEQEVVTFDRDDYSNDNREVISNLPPVLELNSHVPFLQLGGQGSSESSDITEEDQQPTIANKENLVESAEKEIETLRNVDSPITTVSSLKIEKTEKESSDETSLTLLPSTVGTNTLQETHSTESKDEKHHTGTQFGKMVPTSHIPLTPADLKVLAEYLINEKITPAASVNESVYAPNQWLKGNLTSEEKMASILSAANISIGIMNKTESRTNMIKPETSTKTNEIIRADKYDKNEVLYTGNNILDSGSKGINKTGNLHNKYSGDRAYSKNYLHTEQNDGVGLETKTTTDPTSHEVPTPTADINTEFLTDKNIEHISSHSLAINEYPTETVKGIRRNHYSKERSEEPSPIPTTSNDSGSVTTEGRSTKDDSLQRTTVVNGSQDGNIIQAKYEEDSSRSPENREVTSVAFTNDDLTSPKVVSQNHQAAP